jgi:hypothetical protein
VEAHLGETGDFVRRAAISTKKRHFVLNLHPTLIPAIKAGFVGNVRLLCQTARLDGQCFVQCHWVGFLIFSSFLAATA